MNRKHRPGTVLRTAALVLAFSLAQGGLVAETVNISDPNLEAAIRETLQKPEGDITVADMESLTVLIVHWDTAGVSDLTGLESATNLTSLDIRVSKVSDLSPLAGLVNLTELKLQGSSISDISPLAGLVNLTGLRLLGPLGSGNVSDISPLANLTNLTWLSLGGNAISDISPLAELTNLIELTLSYNQVSDLSPLAELTNLTVLLLAENEISDLSPLAGLTNLTWIGLYENFELNDLGPLAGLTNLTGLDLEGLSVSDISPLANLTNLTWLSLGGNAISDISPLANLIKLEWLDLSSNRISDLSPLERLTNLRDGVPVPHHEGWRGFASNGLFLWRNYIDITPGSPARQIIDELNAIEGLTVEFESQYDPEPLIGGIPMSNSEDWYRCDWWGEYCTTFAPWIYHAEHGFLYRDPSSTYESMFVYDNAMDAWCWTGETVYPFIYAFNPPADNGGTNAESCWLFYFEGSKEPRSYSVVTGADAGSFLYFNP